MMAIAGHGRERYDFDPTMFYENLLWNGRPDGIVIKKNNRTRYILEFKRSSDRNEDSLRVKEDEANEQHRSIIEALKAAALEDEANEQHRNIIEALRASAPNGRLNRLILLQGGVVQ